MKYAVLFYFMALILAHSQDDALMGIIESGHSLEVRQEHLDSLLKAREGEMPSETLADFYHDLGSKWYHNNWWDYGKDADLEKALLYTKKAFDMKKDLGGLEAGSLERSNYNLGYFNFLKGDFYTAKDYYLTLIRTGKEERLVQKANLGLGLLYVSVGDFFKALERFQDHIDTYGHPDSLEVAEKQNLAEVYIFKADTYSRMGIQNFSNPIRDHLDRAEELLKMTEAGDEFTQYLYRLINQLEGNRLLELERYADALPYHRKVLNDSLYLSDFDISIAYNSLAYSQLSLQQYEAAKKSLRRAISYNPNYSHPYENLGDLYLAQNDFEQALRNYQKAILWNIDKTREMDIRSLPTIDQLELATDKVFLLGHIVSKANCWLRYYKYDGNDDHLTRALATFALADELVDIVRSESTEYQSKLFWREKGASLYMKAVEVCHLLNEPETAYYFMERNKALLLLEDITDEQAKDIAQLPDVVARREFELKQAILLTENNLRIAENQPTDTLAVLRKRIFDAKSQYDRFTDSLAREFPEYMQLKKNVDVLAYEEFKNRYVSEEEVVLQYILNNDQGFGLLSTEGRSFFFPLDSSGMLQDSIVALTVKLADLATSRQKKDQYQKLAHFVFEELLPEEAQQTLQGKKATIIADHTLQQLPFESLVVDANTGTYLIEETEIRYAYSISYLDAKKQLENLPNTKLLGLAPVQFAALGLPDLQFSAEEIDAVERIYSGQLFVNENATKANFLGQLDQYRIVHLSTHADVGEGDNPWIAFRDEKIFLNEIYANKNQADMVVLSACNTSLGELKKGEGVMSLARGFFHSGAKSVISSLWTINDKASKDLIIDFYKGLDAGLSKSAALRQAKLAYIERYRDTSITPAYWGGLIVIGDNAPLTSKDHDWMIAVWIILGLAALGIFWRLIGKRTHDTKKVAGREQIV